MSEIWKPVVGFEGAYEVSDRGRVRSLDRVLSNPIAVRGYPRKIRGQILKPVLRKDGYVQFACCGVLLLGHVCVAEAFIGPRPAGQLVLHANDIKNDNRVSNLSWGTPKQNSEDAVASGLSPRGERNGCAVLTQADVQHIRSLAGRHLQKDIATMFGVQQQNISRIINRKRWAHV